MTISERIFERLAQLSMTQKKFSEKTGIQPSTISEWKKNKTNPSSEKIMPICEALGVTPYWLLFVSVLWAMQKLMCHWRKSKFVETNKRLVSGGYKEDDQ
ncbi:helix-turn-helix domain-containing protein [Lachnospiraceae bacterium C1.1]|nr:helix-turn-helix transcriptional regulator [Lachnospiraceae bacterium C1.1]